MTPELLPLLFFEKPAATQILRTALGTAGRAAQAIPRLSRSIGGGVAAPMKNFAQAIKGRTALRGGGETQRIFAGPSDVLKLFKPNVAGGEGYKILGNQFRRVKGPGRLPLYNMEPAFNPGGFGSVLPFRNLVPGMPRMSLEGSAWGGSVVRQPLVNGTRATARNVRDWMRTNGVTPLRRPVGSAVLGVSPTAGSASSSSSMIPARAGIARVPDGKWLGVLPRTRHILMDDIRPSNFRMTTQGARPFDLAAGPVSELRALQVPQMRQQMFDRLKPWLGLGAVGSGGLGALSYANRN